jgi:dipeptidyl aminopeptidase/acylaminoacyl peptidase
MVLLTAWAVAIASAMAAPAPVLPVETFFRNPTFTQLSFSPDGKSIALLQSVEKRMNLVVLNLEKMEKNLLTRFTAQNITAYQWVGNDHLAFFMDDDGNEFFGMFVIKRDGTGYKKVSGGAGMSFLSRIEGDDAQILVLRNSRRAEYPDVYRVNLRDGRNFIHTMNPGSVTEWIADRAGVVRIGIATEKDRVRVLHRPTNEAKWEEIDSRRHSDPEWLPLGFDGDNRTLYVATSEGRATAAVYRYNTMTRQRDPEPVCADPVYDAGDLIYSRSLKKVVGINYQADQPRTVWLDEKFVAHQRVVDGALPDTVNLIREATPDGQALLVHASSDREPGVYYAMDLARRKINEIAVTREWIDPAQMAAVRPVQLAARDGLALRGYLTLPTGREPRRLPLVLLVHGGPYGIRDTWGFDNEAQFLANRGFAVLQVNYRGSGGYGPAFQAAGYQRWGLEMQDDLTDAVKWAIAEEIADPARVVIMGASYGGYAVMAGLTFTPELYCAGVNIVGAASMKQFLFDRRHAPEYMDLLLAERWGDLKRDKERLERTAPENFIERVRAPVFMAYGQNDPRVPVEHGWRLEAALKKAGKPYEIFVKDDEGHGFRKEGNAIELYQKVDEFLRRHVPAS